MEGPPGQRGRDGLPGNRGDPGSPGVGEKGDRGKCFLCAFQCNNKVKCRHIYINLHRSCMYGFY